MSEEGFYEVEHLPTVVLARRVTQRKVVRTDRGKITLEVGDIELLDPVDGSFWGNVPDSFLRRYKPHDNRATELFDAIEGDGSDD
jgi:hypothetical protein